MSFLLESVDISSCLENAKFFIDNTELVFSEYERINSNIPFKIITGGKSNNVFVHPGGDLPFLICLISTAITLYLENMKESTNHLLKHLNDGDLVEIDGAHVRYRGLTRLEGNDQDQVLLEYANGFMYLDINKVYRLQPYNGTSLRLNKMPTKKSTKKNKTKAVVSSILNIDKTELSGILKYSTLIIAPKQKIDNLLRGLKIGHQDFSYEFTSIFPCAYYPAVDNLQHFPGNYSKGEPLLKFTSKISTAKELIINNRESIKSVIILGEEMYQNSIYEIEQILKRKSIHDTTIILEWSKIKTIEYLLNDDYETNVYAWTESALLDNINLFTMTTSNMNTGAYSAQVDLINNYLDRQVNTHVVDCSNTFIERITETRNKLKSLANTEVQDEDKDEFIRIAYSLVKLFEKSCFPIRDIENAIDCHQIATLHPLNSINILKDLKKTILDKVLPINFQYELDKIISNLKELREIILDENPKWVKLNTYIQNMGRSHKNAVILPKQYHVNVLMSNKFSDKLLHSVEICAISKFKPIMTYDEVLLPGFYEHKNFDIYNNCYIKKLTLFLYPTEVGLFNWKKRKNDQILQVIEKRNLLDNEDLEEEYMETQEKDIGSIESIKSREADTHSIIQLEGLMHQLIAKQASQLNNSFDSPSYLDKVESVRTILFESGEKSFFTKYFKPNVIDRDSENIIDKNVEQLCIGDELVFIKNEVNTERDIIENIISELMRNEVFQRQYGRLRDLSNVWKHILRKYVVKSNFTEAYISKRLLSYGVNRNPATIANWIKDKKIIGPNGEEVYDALALITDDQYFINHSKDVYLACCEIRKLQVKIKKNLARSIVKSVISEAKSEFDMLVESTIGDLSALANIVQIEQIFETTMDVPLYIANKLIEE